MGKKILCVDDSPTIRMLVKKSLTPEGFEIIEAENGQEALDKSKAEDIGLFIVDVNMPVMNGFDFVRKIKTVPEFGSTPIVFLTTESAAEKKAIGKELGVNGWIVKPFDGPSLVKLTKMLIG
jgi:two-component system, chemotaxis family, chemotaxis protein CheY